MAKIAAVLGLGAVGSTIAAKLIESGWEVRSADTREKPEREFDFIDGSSRRHYAIPALADPKKADILIITLKAFATGKAVRPLRNRFRPQCPSCSSRTAWGRTLLLWTFSASIPSTSE